MVGRCKGIKNNGKRCTREVDGDYCYQHQPDFESNAGRKSKYHDVDLEEVEEWCQEGLTDYEIAKRLGIGTRTLYDWKNQYPQFSQVLKRGKEQADYRVEDSLYKRAIGYKYDEITKEMVEDYKTGEQELRVTKIITKEVKPDTTAQIFWLKNRQPHKWKDKQEVEHDIKNISGVEIEFIDDEHES